MPNEDKTGVENTTRQGKLESKASGTEQPLVHSSNVRAVAELAVFYLGIPALTLYPFGVTLYWLQIMYGYAESNESAGYAAALIPRTTVILEATYDLTAVVVASLLLGALPALWFSLLLAKGWSFVWGIGWRRAPIRRLLFLLASAAYGLLVLLLSLELVFALSEGDQYGVTSVGAWFSMLVAGILGGYVIGRDYRNSRLTAEQGGPVIPARRWLLRGLAVMYLTAALAVWLFTGLGQAPDLPAVKVGEDKEIEGLLLGVSGGHWHILDKEGRILAIPDDQIGMVTICPKETSQKLYSAGREFPGAATDC